MKKLLISIIIPLYNKESCILKTIESVINQDFIDYEIVVVDDGSIDGGLSLVENLKNDHIRIFKKKNGGPSSARNYGVNNARGKWILFLDADDTLEPGALELAAKNIKRHPLIKVFSYNLFVERQGVKKIRNVNHTRGYCPFPFLNWYNNEIYPRTGNMLVKRTVMLRNLYREDLRRYEDGENTFRLMREYWFYACPIPLFSYNQDTLDASYRRENIKEDFLCIMEPDGKSLFEKIAMFKMYREGCQTYPEEMGKIYGNYFKMKLWGRCDLVLWRYLEFKMRIKNLINRF